MGVIKWFSSDSRSNCCFNGDGMVNKETQIIRVNSTPDPTKFKILKNFHVNGYPIFLVQYEDVENYEGRKILMYPKNFNTELLENRMDPHFFTEGDSPIARFEPTKYGWELAMTLAKALRDNEILNKI